MTPHEFEQRLEEIEGRLEAGDASRALDDMRFLLDGLKAAALIAEVANEALHELSSLLPSRDDADYEPEF